MTNPVTSVPAALPQDALRHFEARLAYETDCGDVHAGMASGAPGFLLVDVRSPVLYAKSHVPGAINIPHGKMTQGYMAQYRKDVLLVVYCAGPHCNGVHKAAAKLARLGFSVKEMIGGMTGWADEGFVFETG